MKPIERMECKICQAPMAAIAPSCLQCGNINIALATQSVLGIEKEDEKNCNICKETIDKNPSHCTNCGAPNFHYEPPILRSCRSCKHNVAPNAPSCPKCGALDPIRVKSQIVQCSKCKKDMAENTLFCPHSDCSAQNIGRRGLFSNNGTSSYWILLFGFIILLTILAPLVLILSILSQST